MELFLLFIILVLVIGIVWLYQKTSNIMNRLDFMMESAINDTFSETDFSEEKLSRLETKMYRYLSKGKTAQKQIMAERNTIKELVSDISHQSKTPISNILLYTELLAEKETLEEDAKVFVNQIGVQAEKLNFLIQSLIKTSRLENGIIAVVPKEQNIKELIAAIEHNFTGQVGERTLIFEEVPEIFACFDLKWTLEAVSNIVDNAVKYTSEQGRITISVKEYEMFARIDIEDNGIGMSEEETAKVFTRFYRSPRVSEEKGVGIGLYLAREIISRQGGYIKVSSELGKGSCFSVFLAKQGIFAKKESL